MDMAALLLSWPRREVPVCGHMSSADGDAQDCSHAYRQGLKIGCGMMARLYLGIADGVSSARVWACRNSK